MTPKSAVQLLAEDLLEASPVATVAVDAEPRLLLANASARDLFGERIVGRPFVTVLRNPAVNEAVERVVAAKNVSPGQASEKLTVQLSMQGRDLSMDVTVSPIRLSTGIGAAVAFEDRTRLDRADAMRRDFVANVSHELRTPLTALVGFIETLRGPARNDPVARDRFLDIMEREAGRMNRLIGDLLSLSRVQSEERRRPAESVDLLGLLRSVVTTLSSVAASAGVQIVFHPPDRTILVAADPDQLVQVFHNLIENGVKYGATGGIVTLELMYLEYEPVLRGPAWAITVADQGEGIDPRHVPRLTERFYRVDTHRSREQGGTGLGLAIVKHIINRHRGRLRIESEKGQGSRFTVILPDLS